MLDPLTALGLASNIFQIVDFGFKVLDTGRQLAKTGTTEDRRHLKTLSEDTIKICIQLDTQFGARGSQQGDGHGETDESRKKGQNAISVDGIRGLLDRAKHLTSDITQLMAELDINRGQPGHNSTSKVSKKAVVQKAWKAVWSKEKVESMRDKLADLQRSMILGLLAMQSMSSSTILQSLAKLSEKVEVYPGNREKVPVLETCVEDITQIVLACERAIKRLSFEGVSGREQAIPEAHARTFSWIFDSASTDFYRWACTGRGVYWITGKPGSGKSTLMKFLAHHRRTTELLNVWARGYDLIIAHHYFWNSGNAMQTSQLGLLQTLMIQIIQQGPEAIFDCLPSRFRDGSLDSHDSWTLEELRTTLHRFCQKSQGNVRLCLFIDGLDEYTGTHTDLVDLVWSLTQSPCVKACISSRPWNVFTQAYDKDAGGQLEVHTLTRNDIKAYVSDKINTDKHFRNLRDQDQESCNYFIDEITKRAEGVFLWVYLVVTSLMRGMVNDDTMSILRSRLETYPTSLNAYFQRMLDRVESVYRVESARLILVANFAKDSLPFWTPRCLELEIDDPDYAIKVQNPPSLQDASRVFGCDCAHDEANINIGSGVSDQESRLKQPKDVEKILHKCYYFYEQDRQFTLAQRQALRTKLDARCGDLLEIAPNGITFIHRTARDFLTQHELLEKLHKGAGKAYDTYLSLTRLSVINAKRKAWQNGYIHQAVIDDYLMDFAEKMRTENIPLFDALMENLGYQADGETNGLHQCCTDLRQSSTVRASLAPRANFGVKTMDLFNSERTWTSPCAGLRISDWLKGIVVSEDALVAAANLGHQADKEPGRLHQRCKDPSEVTVETMDLYQPFNYKTTWTSPAPSALTNSERTSTSPTVPNPLAPVNSERIWTSPLARSRISDWLQGIVGRKTL